MMMGAPSPLLTAAWPALDLYFARDKVVPGFATYTGANGSYVNASGIIAPAVTNAARFDHTFAGVSLGALIEVGRTNLNTRSAALDNAAYTKERASISADAVAAPDGLTAADKLVEDSTSSATHTTYFGASGLTDSTVYCASFFMKALERTKGIVALMDKAASTRGMIHDLSAGTAASFASNGITDPTASGIVSYANSWRRGWAAHSVGVGAFTPRAWLQLTNGSTNSYSGDGSSGFYGWGAQLEAGAFPTSYIPTTSAAVTRAADVLTVPVSAFPFDAAACTPVIEVLAPYNSTPLFQVDDGSENNRITIARDSSGHAVCTVVSASSTVASLDLGAMSSTVHDRIAFAASAGSFAASMNGGDPVTDGAGAMPVGLTTCRWGATSAGVAGVSWHKRTQVFAVRRADADLPGLAA